MYIVCACFNCLFRGKLLLSTLLEHFCVKIMVVHKARLAWAGTTLTTKLARLASAYHKADHVHA